MLALLAFMLILPCADGSSTCAAAAPFSPAVAETAAPPSLAAEMAQPLYETADYRNFSYYADYYNGQSAHIIWGGPSLLSHAAFELKPAGIYTMPPQEEQFLCRAAQTPAPGHPAIAPAAPQTPADHAGGGLI